MSYVNALRRSGRFTLRVLDMAAGALVLLAIILVL